MQGARIWLPNIEGFFTSLGRLLESAEGQRNTKSKISGVVEVSFDSRISCT